MKTCPLCSKELIYQGINAWKEELFVCPTTPFDTSFESSHYRLIPFVVAVAEPYRLVQVGEDYYVYKVKDGLLKPIMYVPFFEIKSETQMVNRLSTVITFS